ncbi:hypothetical protein F4860DRAFT_481323 [Xylaria cubensis]|nr:hypothetical protein F4860DRAFT_481323 [Xylaria cubensis]
MCELRVIEQEFKVYALSAIFGSQRLPFPLPRDENLMPFRLLEPAFGPKPLWEAPPLLGDEKKKYTWDNHPDCSFALSMQAFKHSVTPDVETCTVLFSNFAIYPYLSIEFKKTTTQTTKTAIHQLMVASTMALYNRYRLKCDVRKDKQWSAADYTQMRHYGIMFQASSWTLFCTVPEGLLCDKPKCTEPGSTPKSYDNNKLQSLSWTGCKMLMMDKGDCKVERGTRKLLYYLIQIHLWGMYTHGKSCKEDITEFIAFSRLDDYQGLEKLGRLKLTEGGANGN